MTLKLKRDRKVVFRVEGPSLDCGKWVDKASRLLALKGCFSLIDHAQGYLFSVLAELSGLVRAKHY